MFSSHLCDIYVIATSHSVTLSHLHGICIIYDALSIRSKNYFTLFADFYTLSIWIALLIQVISCIIQVFAVKKGARKGVNEPRAIRSRKERKASYLNFDRLYVTSVLVCVFFYAGKLIFVICMCTIYLVLQYTNKPVTIIIYIMSYY